MSQIIQNAVRVKQTGKIYISRNVHDFVSILLPNKQEYFIDGGKDYFRRGYSKTAKKYIEDISLTVNDKFEDICDKLVWGTYGKNGKEPLTWVLLKNCETDHLKNILKDKGKLKDKLSDLYIKVIQSILKKR